MQVRSHRVGNDVNGAAGVRTGDTASGRDGGKAIQTVNMRNPCNDVNGAAGVRTGRTASGKGGSKAIQTVNVRNPCRWVGLRVGSANVGTMRGRSAEVADMIDRRRLDFLCVQETGWKVKGKWLESNRARCKFFGTGSSIEGLSGVGVLVAEKWCENVMEVKRPSERVIVVRVAIGKLVMNVISVYAPQVGRTMVEKEEFLDLLREVISGIDDREGMILCGDLNCHVGANADGFEDVHGGNGFGLRNVEGEMVLELAHALDLIVANTWFTKEESKKITCESGGSRTVVDYVLVRRRERAMVKDVTVVTGEACLPRHKLIVCRIKANECVTKGRSVS